MKTKQHHRGAHRPSKPRRTPVLGIVVGLVALLTVVAAIVGRRTEVDDRFDVAVRIAGSALPVLGDGPDAAAGRPVPEIDGVGFDGSAVSIARDGRPKAILLLAHWCPHCQREVPIVQRMVGEGLVPDGVDLVSVATAIDSARPNYPPDAWLEREGWTVPVLVDDHRDSASDALGLDSFPFWVFTGADGDVVLRHAGVLDEDQLATVLARLA